VKVERGPILVCCVDKKWLVTSIDGFLNFTVDGKVFPCALEILNMSSPTTLNKAHTTAAQILNQAYCSFGDNLIKMGIKCQFSVQCIHHVCVMKVYFVLFDIAYNQKLLCMMSFDFEKTDLDMYEKLLDTVSVS
jgi:hypothetical protein